MSLAIEDLSSPALTSTVHVPFPMMTPPFRLLIVAPSGTGKSNIIRNILTRPRFGYKQAFGDRIFVVSPTHRLDDNLDFVPEDRKADKFTDEFVTKVLYGETKRKPRTRKAKEPIGMPGTISHAMHQYTQHGNIGIRVHQEEMELRDQRREYSGSSAAKPSHEADGLQHFKTPEGQGDEDDDGDTDDPSNPDFQPKRAEWLMNASDDDSDTDEGGRQSSSPASSNAKQHRLLIMDDVIGTGALRTNSNNTINQLFCSGRHYGLSLILVSQKYRAVPDIIRSNSTHTILMHGIPRYQLRKAAEEQSIEPEQFKAVYDYATQQPYSFVYINFLRHPSLRYFKCFTQQIMTPTTNPLLLTDVGEDRNLQELQQFSGRSEREGRAHLGARLGARLGADMGVRKRQRRQREEQRRHKSSRRRRW